MELFIYRLIVLLFFIVLLIFIAGLIKPTLVIRWGALEKRNRKHVLMYYGTSLIIIFSIMCYSIYQYGDDYTNYEQYDASSYNTGTTYEQLAITPSTYRLQKVRFTGTVIQAIDTKSGQTQLRVAVNNDYNNIIFVEYRNDKISQIFLKNDNITASGRFIGIFTYTSTQNVSISIPGMWADNIDLNSSKTN